MSNNCWSLPLYIIIFSNCLTAFSTVSLTTLWSKCLEFSISNLIDASRFCIASSVSVWRPLRRASSSLIEGGAININSASGIIFFTFTAPLVSISKIKFSPFCLQSMIGDWTRIPAYDYRELTDSEWHLYFDSLAKVIAYRNKQHFQPHLPYKFNA